MPLHVHIRMRDANTHVHVNGFEESEHPRGQPKNAGQFTKGGVGSSGRAAASENKQKKKNAIDPQEQELAESPEHRQNFVNDVVSKYSKYFPDLKIKVEDDPDILERVFAYAARGRIGRIGINPKYWNSKNLKRAAGSKSNKREYVDSTAAGTLVHEIGHLVYDEFRKKVGEKEAAAFIDQQMNAAPPPSNYALYWSEEYAAESFAAYHLQKVAVADTEEQQDAALTHVNKVWKEILSKMKS